VSMVPLWSGREVRALRAARRMSVREFATHLGVSDRMVSKWEAGGDAIRPRPLNQAALDTSLGMASADVRNRFTRIALRHSLDTSHPSDEVGRVRHLLRHPLDGKLMTLIEAGPFRPTGDRGTLWLPAYYIDLHATTRREFDQFLVATEGGFDHLALAALEPESTVDPPEIFDDKGPIDRTPVDRTPVDRTPVDRTSVAWDPAARVPRPTGKPAGSDDQPMIGISREEALTYARWTGKTLPTVDEWDRAQRGREGVVSSGIAEWCLSSNGLVRRGRGREKTGFRCSTPLLEMLALLAI
jgi:transcriptional regulator with XRE-family HTH domain